VKPAARVQQRTDTCTACRWTPTTGVTPMRAVPAGDNRKARVIAPSMSAPIHAPTAPVTRHDRF